MEHHLRRYSHKRRRSSLRKTSGPVIKKTNLLAPLESSRTFLSSSPRVASIGEERSSSNANLDNVDNDQVCAFLHVNVVPFGPLNFLSCFLMMY